MEQIRKCVVEHKVCLLYTSAEYKAVKTDIEWALCHIREKQHKPRGLEGKVAV